jgi:hypothetical protein
VGVTEYYVSKSHGKSAIYMRSPMDFL